VDTIARISSVKSFKFGDKFNQIAQLVESYHAGGLRALK